MKTRNYLLLFAPLLFTFNSKAQVPNGSFENWTATTFNNKTVNEPQYWSTQNTLSVFGNYEETALKITDSYDEDYALKLVNKPNVDNMPAFATSMRTFNNGDSMVDRFPISQKPTHLTGYYKYEYTNKDTGSIMVFTYNDNGRITGIGMIEISTEQSSYKKFSVPIVYQPGDDAATYAAIYISAGSSDNFKLGTTLYVDKLDLGTSTGITEATEAPIKVSVSPNPCSDKAIIRFEQKYKTPVSIVLYDMLGNEVMHIAQGKIFVTGQHEIEMDIRLLNKGIYLLQVQQGDHSKTTRICIQ